MGCVGYGPLDSDEGMDALTEFEAKVAKGAKPEEAVEELLKEWGPSGYRGIESKVLGLVALCWQKEAPVSAKLRDIALDAVHQQLEAVAEEEWDSPAKRRAALREMLKKLGGSLTDKRPKRKDPQIHFDSIEECKRTLMKLSSLNAKSGWITVFGAVWDWPTDFLSEEESKWIKKNMPSFIQKLYGMMNEGIGEKGASVFDPAWKERKMMLACLLSLISSFDPKESEALLDRCIKPLTR